MQFQIWLNKAGRNGTRSIWIINCLGNCVFRRKSKKVNRLKWSIHEWSSHSSLLFLIPADFTNRPTSSFPLESLIIQPFFQHLQNIFAFFVHNFINHLGYSGQISLLNENSTSRRRFYVVTQNYVFAPTGLDSPFINYILQIFKRSHNII